MAWLTATEIRDKFNIQSNAHGPQIDAAVDDADLIIRRSVSEEIYNEAVSDTPPVETAAIIRQLSVIQSHKYLTMWVLSGDSGIKLGGDGFIEESQDSASPALNSRIVTNRYLTPEKLQPQKAEWLEKAKFYMGDYGTIDIGTNEEVVTAEQDLAMSSLQWF